jgi:hypothetical protein
MRLNTVVNKYRGRIKLNSLWKRLFFYFMLCIGLFSAPFFFAQAQNANEPDRRVGGPCEYDVFEGACRIISAEKSGASIQQGKDISGPGYEGVEVNFEFILPEGGISYVEHRANQAGYALRGPRAMRLTNSWYPGKGFIRKYKITPGSVFDCSVNIIKSGTCTPVNISFKDIDLADYSAESKGAVGAKNACSGLAEEFHAKADPANYCEVDSDCGRLDLLLPCSFGCDTYVNVKEKEALEEYWNIRAPDDCEKCVRECPPSAPLCFKNKCAQDYEVRNIRMTDAAQKAIKPGGAGFIYDGGSDPGWRILYDKCDQGVKDRRSCVQCLSGFSWAGVSPDADISAIREGYIEMNVFKVRDAQFPGSIKVFVYGDLAVDEEGNIYTHGELG